MLAHHPNRVLCWHIVALMHVITRSLFYYCTHATHRPDTSLAEDDKPVLEYEGVRFAQQSRSAIIALIPAVLLNPYL